MPPGSSSGSSQLSGSYLCFLVGCCALWRISNYAFSFPSLQKGRADFLRLECHRSSCPGPSLCLPPVSLSLPPTPGCCGLLTHPFLDASPASPSIPFSMVREQGAVLATLAQHTVSVLPGASLYSFRSSHSQIAPLRSGHRRSRARPEVEEGLLGAGERRSFEKELAALLASRPSQLNLRVAASSPQALLL